MKDASLRAEVVAKMLGIPVWAIESINDNKFRAIGDEFLVLSKDEFGKPIGQQKKVVEVDGQTFFVYQVIEGEVEGIHIANNGLKVEVVKVNGCYSIFTGNSAEERKVIERFADEEYCKVIVDRLMKENQ